MGTNYFTDEQLRLLEENPYVVKASKKSITYSEEFKELYWIDYQNEMQPIEIFKKYGFDPYALGARRRDNFTDCLKKQAAREDGFKDTRSKNICPIRKANPARRMAKAIKTSNYADNVLNRHFDEYGPGYVLETDITYLFYGSKHSKAYLSVVKDGFTKQILSYVLSTSLEEDFVLKTINQLFEKHKHDIHTDALIHSDQGAHYTSIRFIDLLKNLEIRQSMSRRGNCWDNAPQESFFGHMKDELGKYIKTTSAYDKLEKVINNYIDYYNNERYQYKLAKLSPNEFFEYYKTGNYPLDHITKEPAEYRKKFKQVKQNLDKNLTIKKLVSVINEISHLK